MSKKNIRVVELFAGVGGFRVGLEHSSPRFVTVWANQWEPNKKVQHAFDCYVRHFGPSPSHVNEDIGIAKARVPSHDLLVGGFPCQDYSVARTGARGIEGQKGVLWWDINDILKSKKPKYVVLENVDRLIKSPRDQRGRDFGMILRCFYDLGYAVEWRVLNAAEYGFAQKRRRTFIFAYKSTAPLYKKLASRYAKKGMPGLVDWIAEDGFFAPAFPVKREENTKKHTETSIEETQYSDLVQVSEQFGAPFYNAGVMIRGQIVSQEVAPVTIPPIPLRAIREEGPVDEKYFLNGSLDKWVFLKGAKKINRVKPNGEPYVFSEGGMSFPDDLDKPARTMLTSESTLNRSTHVIEDAITQRKRLLTPVECEKINGFEPGWTDTGMPERFRYFVMGNALVVPLITKIGDRLLQIE